jgi:MarR family transcriptional regulator, negative regulator of the multidrug operon emrRAB
MPLFLLRDIPKYESLQCQAQRYSGVDPSACEATLVTLRVASDVLQAIEEHLSKHELSVGRFTVLMLLNRDPTQRLKPSELAQKAGVTRATMTGLVEGLVREGLIHRCECPGDRRMCSIELTKKGRRKLDSMLPDYYERIAGLMGGLSKGDRRKLVELLGKIAEGIPAVVGGSEQSAKRRGTCEAE